jgi:glycerol-3-phosphate dehydrogenase
MKSLTGRIELAGGCLGRDTKAEAESASTRYGVSLEAATHLVETYGGNFRAVLEITTESEELKEPLIDGLPHIAAEVVYAARAEMVVTVEDFLARRTRIRLLARGDLRSCAARVAALMAGELGWSAAEAQEAIADLSP